jgi:hypothetical protein
MPSGEGFGSVFNRGADWLQAVRLFQQVPAEPISVIRLFASKRCHQNAEVLVAAVLQHEAFAVKTCGGRQGNLDQLLCLAETVFHALFDGADCGQVDVDCRQRGFDVIKAFSRADSAISRSRVNERVRWRLRYPCRHHQSTTENNLAFAAYS